MLRIFQPDSPAFDKELPPARKLSRMIGIFNKCLTRTAALACGVALMLAG
jgi:hypothetical protein